MKKMEAVTDGEDKTLDMIWEVIQEHEEKQKKRGLPTLLKSEETNQGEKT